MDSDFSAAQVFEQLPTSGTKLETRIWGKKEFGTTSHITQECSSWTKHSTLGWKLGPLVPNAAWISLTIRSHTYCSGPTTADGPIHSMTGVVVLCSADLPLRCHSKTSPSLHATLQHTRLLAPQESPKWRLSSFFTSQTCKETGRFLSRQAVQICSDQRAILCTNETDTGLQMAQIGIWFSQT